MKFLSNYVLREYSEKFRIIQTSFKYIFNTFNSLPVLSKNSVYLVLRV